MPPPECGDHEVTGWESGRRLSIVCRGWRFRLRPSENCWDRGGGARFVAGGSRSAASRASAAGEPGLAAGRVVAGQRTACALRAAEPRRAHPVQRPARLRRGDRRVDRPTPGPARRFQGARRPYRGPSRPGPHTLDGVARPATTECSARRSPRGFRSAGRRWAALAVSTRRTNRGACGRTRRRAAEPTPRGTSRNAHGRGRRGPDPTPWHTSQNAYGRTRRRDPEPTARRTSGSTRGQARDRGAEPIAQRTWRKRAVEGTWR
ncbi:hypothetical protein FNL39_105412 [Nocardia caishijiensis]|uniref:Uncharacterized protein n=1 Tax=Nocardia caishijiensis TaxID=184756 RepID=A0ABQ6YL43_9NOCA|nr:hypothetical protein FNL39_105412 [Nocardia caishijiensis]